MSGEYCDELPPLNPVLADTDPITPIPAGHPAIKIYPNPTTGNFTIACGDISGGETIVAEIFDMRGKKVISKTIKYRETEVTLADYPAGVYLVKLNTPQGLFLSKVIKR